MSRTASLLLLALAGCSGEGRSTVEPPKMIDVEAGVFTMGAPADADTQQGKPQHRVAVRAFRLGETEVTFDQYDRFAAATGRPLPQDDGLGRGSRPVINVLRADMLAYIDWLNRESGQAGFRLPSEAEWEYAARAGTTTGFYWGDEPDARYANSRLNEGPDTFKFTAPVRSFPPNPWGFYDIAGNVWEMTADCRFNDYVGAPADGSARTRPGCPSFIVRGGDFGSVRRGQRPSSRVGVGEHFRSTSIGFRLAQDMPAK